MSQIHELEFNAPQGETSYDAIRNYVRSSMDRGRGRPKQTIGAWRLNNGDWAYRNGARFVKNESGQYVEST